MLPKLIERNYISEYYHKYDMFFNDNMERKTDFEIYLKKYKTNLQRDYCWNLFQQQQLIHSIILQRHIPPITVV